MKGQSRQGRRIVVLLLVLFVLQLQSWRTPAPFVDLTYFEATFFVRTNETSGLVVTRGFNSKGPLDKQRLFTGVPLVAAGVGNGWLGVEGNHVIHVQPNGEASVETGPADLNNSPVAVAYDWGKDRAFAASGSGAGSLLQRIPNQPWSLISGMNNIHIVALGYFPEGDGIWGLRQYENAPTASAVFTKFSTNGVALEDFTTNGFPVNIGTGGYSCHIVQDGMRGTRLLLEKPYNVTLAPGDISRIYYFDPVAPYFYLSFENVYGLNPPSLRVSNVRTNGEVVTLGSTLNFNLEAFDSDNDLQKVELIDNGVVVKEWTVAPEPTATTNTFSQAWTAAVEGAHTLTARARDAGGNVTEIPVPVTVVKVRVDRTFPGTRLMAGQTISVSLAATPAAGIPPYTIKERPPADWTVSPQNQGTLDPTTHEITWGPFNDAGWRSVTYLVTGPVSSSLSNFVGNASIDGTSTPTLGPSWLELVPPRAPTVEFLYNLGGQTELLPGTPVGIYIKATDLDGDLHSAEIRCDGALLQRWDIAPNWYYQDPQFSTAWFANEPGLHTFTAHVEDLLGNVADKSTTLNLVFRSGVDVSRNLPTNVIAGQSFTVRLNVLPGGADPSWTIKERPPTGWQVRVRADASVNPETHEITWGPFADPRIERTFTYDMTAPVGATEGIFAGEVWINGAATPITNRNKTHVLPPAESSVQWVDSTHVTIHFNAFPGIFFIVESADSVNSTNWTPIDTILGGDQPIQVGPLEVPNQQQFFRLRPN